jgi:hypothetical protein
MMVENLMLQVPISEIGDDQPLFGPNSLGLIPSMRCNWLLVWTRVLG